VLSRRQEEDKNAREESKVAADGRALRSDTPEREKKRKGKNKKMKNVSFSFFFE